jgi:hypothetical protein
MKVSREDYDAIQRLFTEHDEDVRGYDPELFGRQAAKALSVWRWVFVGALLVMAIWGAVEFVETLVR